MENERINLQQNSIIGHKEIQLGIEREKYIRGIVDVSIKNFIEGFEWRYSSEVDNPLGVINMKKNNCFIAQLGEEFMFYSAFVRSFDSSFGKVLENMGNQIAKLTYDVKSDVHSYLLPQQSQHMDFLMSEYEKSKRKPLVSDYDSFNCVYPKDIRSYEKMHKTDNYFYNPSLKKHYLIEVKAGGDLDNKKAKAEKIALLQEYFILKNKLVQTKKTDETVEIYFATAYNKFGEGKKWKQERVQQFFADDELLIGQDYWNFCCGSENGFKIVFDQYKESSYRLREAFDRIKKLYF